MITFQSEIKYRNDKIVVPTFMKMDIIACLLMMLKDATSGTFFLQNIILNVMWITQASGHSEMGLSVSA